MKKLLAGLKDRLVGSKEAQAKTGVAIATCIGGVAALCGTDIDPDVIAGIATTIATVLGLLGK